MSTPIMAQYKQIKKENEDSLLFFRLGDFYELFYEDAKIAASTLNITLTKRAHKHEDIPMAGVPYHTSEYYISKLIKAGYKVAICEQKGTELNKDKIIPREVVQIITPGTVTNDEMLDGKRNNFLINIEGEGLTVCITTFDITTNEFFLEEILKLDIKNYLEKIDPSEILVQQNWAIKLKEYGIASAKVTVIQSIASFHAEKTIMDFFNLYSNQSIEYLSPTNKISVATIIEYIKHTQKQSKIHIKLPKKVDHIEKNEVELDIFTRRNLEITKTLQNNFKGSLLSFIDQTQTAQGGRKIYKYLTNPIKNIEKLNKRYANIEFFIQQTEARKKTIQILRLIPDFERILSKILLRKATANQVFKLAVGAKKLYEICQILNKPIAKHEKLFNDILSALDENSPNTLSPDEPYIKTNYNKELDQWKLFHKDIYNQIDTLQLQYQKLTQLNSLKIKNSPFGFLVEINNSNKEKLPYSFELKQSLKTSSRFSTKELDEINIKFSHSEDFIKKKEKEILIVFFEEIEKISTSVYEYAEISSSADVFSNLAEIAIEYNHSQPILTDTNDFDIRESRHPILEKLFLEKGEVFVPNNCNLTQKVMFMTGPNMAGKSTYLRQQAIICLLAHCGMYVPCEYAKIGVVDQIFSRISTNDDIMHGNSTFMMEMIEMALTLNRATNKSFLILDEVGRGTSVEEGVALAQSILEYLLKSLNARTIFATHYLSLGEINHINIQKKMMHITQNPLTFSYKLINGVASKSYAIEIAKLAGMPKEVLERAQTLLAQTVVNQ